MPSACVGGCVVYRCMQDLCTEDLVCPGSGVCRMRESDLTLQPNTCLLLRLSDDHMRTYLRCARAFLDRGC